MTARPVAPVIPAASPGRHPQGKFHGAAPPMPLARPLGRPDVVYGFGRIDASGRVADRVTIAALGWRGGDRLTLTADAGVMCSRAATRAAWSPCRPALRRDPGRAAPPLRAAGAGSLARPGHTGRVLLRGGGPGAAGHALAGGEGMRP